MKRLTLLFLSFILLLSGCAPYIRQTPEEETSLITVGFSQVGAESDWRVANTESMRESLSEENGFELLFDNARQKQENQFKAIRTFIQQDVDYIVLGTGHGDRLGKRPGGSARGRDTGHHRGPADQDGRSHALYELGRL